MGLKGYCTERHRHIKYIVLTIFARAPYFYTAQQLGNTSFTLDFCQNIKKLVKNGRVHFHFRLFLAPGPPLVPRSFPRGASFSHPTRAAPPLLRPRHLLSRTRGRHRSRGRRRGRGRGVGEYVSACHFFSSKIDSPLSAAASSQKRENTTQRRRSVAGGRTRRLPLQPRRFARGERKR